MSERSNQAIIEWRLGKITNKYLILDIFAKAYHTIDEAIYRMFYTDKRLRNLTIKEFRYLKSRNQRRLQTLNLDFFKEDNILRLKPFTFILTKHDKGNP